MLNFSVMPLDEEHVAEYCEDIAEQVNKGVATMPLFCFTLTPEGDPVIDKADICRKKYLKYKKRLDGMGIPSGVLIQATIGHGWKLDSPAPFQRYVGLSDGAVPEVCCPLDEGFREYLREAGRKIASAHPAHIMLDDDFRLMGSRPGRGCACPLHMARFSELAGRSVTREELWRILNSDTSETARFRELFIRTQIGSLTECASVLREGIDREDPRIPGSYCLCGKSAEGAYEIASVMAGKNNPVVLRVNNGNYCATDPRRIVMSLVHGVTQIAALTKIPDVLLAETDTFPQNRYSTSAAELHSLFSFSLLQGMSGAKHWITRLHAYEPESGRAYREKLTKYSGFYAELARLAPELEWLGCAVPVPPKAIYALTDGDAALAKSDPWCSPVLDRLGFPVRFTADPRGVCFFGGTSEAWFDDERWKELLAGTVILDAPAAKALISRGFGEYIGVDVRDRAPGAENPSGEIVYPDGHSSVMPQVRELIPLSDEVKRLSDVYHLRNNAREILFPGVTSCKNKLGGAAVVFSGSADTDRRPDPAFGFLNETRKAQIAAILRDAGCLPVWYPGDAEVFMKAARTKDGGLFCALLDMSLDSIEELPLATERPVRGVRRLMPDGSYEDVGFRGENGLIRLALTACPFDPVILMADVG